VFPIIPCVYSVQSFGHDFILLRCQNERRMLVLMFSLIRIWHISMQDMVSVDGWRILLEYERCQGRRKFYAERGVNV
jgi:hypothetical protein